MGIGPPKWASVSFWLAVNTIPKKGALHTHTHEVPATAGRVPCREPDHGGKGSVQGIIAVTRLSALWSFLGCLEGKPGASVFRARVDSVCSKPTRLRRTVNCTQLYCSFGAESTIEQARPR